ncbi:hypothetical protein KGP36_03615 [Patescibacteria group bacterium]|nr:hypothetical protein [Patescibacteria group bacterium]
MNRLAQSDPVTLESIAISLKATRNELIESIKPLATTNELTESIKPLATKKELTEAMKPLATKKELAEAIKPLATKNELIDAIKPLATKNELTEAVKPLATKKELGNVAQLLDDLAIAVNNGFERIETRLDSLDERVERNHKYAVGQLDYIMLHYARREEYVDFNGRLRVLERKCAKYK